MVEGVHNALGNSQRLYFTADGFFNICELLECLHRIAANDANKIKVGSLYSTKQCCLFFGITYITLTRKLDINFIHWKVILRHKIRIFNVCQMCYVSLLNCLNPIAANGANKIKVVSIYSIKTKFCQLWFQDS